MSRPLVCVDLDRTIIYSPAALALSMPDEQAPRLLCVEVYGGTPLSFLTECAAGLLRRLGEAATLVPVTTRTPQQLARVHLPGVEPRSESPSAGSRFAIASNGGRLIVDGHPDPAWDDLIATRLASVAPLAEVQEHLQATSGEFLQSPRVADEKFVYAVVDRARLPAGRLEELTGFCLDRGWSVSLQGRKVYCVPQPLTKSAAVTELAARTEASIVLASGDSLLDRELLQIADRAIRPAAGELADVGWTAPHVTLAQTPGVLGGEEILEWLLAEVSRPARQATDLPLQLDTIPT